MSSSRVDFQKLLANNPWIIDHSLPVTKINNEDLAVLMAFSYQLVSLKDELHPALMKIIYKIRYSIISERVSDNNLRYASESHFAVVLAEQLALLPKDLLTEEDNDFILKMTIWKLTR